MDVPDSELDDLEVGRREAFTPLPPDDWTDADFNDHHWPIYPTSDLEEYLGGWGAPVLGDPAWVSWVQRVSMRSRFGIQDPRRVEGLRLTVEYIGGAVVYVNGREIGRGHIRAGDLYSITPAQPYPREAYVDADGDPLSSVRPGGRPEAELADRYEQRIRRLTIDIPRDALVAGSNVISIDLHRAPTAGPTGRDRWNHVGFRSATLSSPAEASVISYDRALEGTRISVLPAEQQVAVRPSERSVIRRGGRALIWTQGMQVRGAIGTPFDPVRPIRMASPRNGFAAGQVVLADPAGLRQVSARLAGDLAGPGRATMSAGAVEIRYAVQPDDLHYADSLPPTPPDGAPKVPVWLLVEVPRGQQPGWYSTRLELQANDQRFTVPVQILVTGHELPDPRDFEGTRISLEQCPRSVALRYGVEPWSDRHWALLERSFKLMGKVGSDVVTAPVIHSNFPAAGRPHPPGRSGNELTWRQPLVRFIRSGEELRPDLSLLERYLDLFEKHVGPPKAISLWIWDPASALELARAYEGGVREHSVDRQTSAPVMVEVYDPRTGRSERAEVPHLLHDDAEAFWKPMLEAVRQMVRKRGWNENIIMLGLGSDVRAGQRTGERLREWAPFARWELLSHFSGETPGRLEDGRFITTGQLEAGLRRWPWMRMNTFLPAAELERRFDSRIQDLELPTARWHHDPNSPPAVFRELPLMWGRLGRIGLDFWMGHEQGPTNRTFFSHVESIAAPGADGAEPTVRFVLLRLGVQEFEIRHAIIKASRELPEDQRNAHHELLDELGPMMMSGGRLRTLSQTRLAYDIPGYMARLQEVAAQLSGVKSEARWDEPPQP
ncbi:MAG: hypothetical protein JJU36_00910 [Phycisphaeraceae bacterium]|nr:hypothetical protein [Phycisphaeraceae bacterium]